MSFCWSWRKGGRIESAPQPGPSPELERLQHELRHLKRALRDLVALSVMPAAWVGRSSRDIANGVLELLFSTLRLEAAYVCIDAIASEGQCEVVKCTEGAYFQKWIEENKEKLRPRRKLEGVLPPVLLASDSAAHLRLEARAIGMDRSFGFVVVGSCRPDFPREEEKLLLSVAANQAATALQSAQLAAEQAAVSKELIDSEERFRAIVETTPECVKLVAADGTLLHMNSAGLAMIGAECADLALGKNIYDVIAPENREKFRDFNERICRGERGSLEFDIIGLTGVRRHMETHAAPLRTNNGSVVQLGVTRDVSEKKRAEKGLRESEQRFRSLSACSPVGFFLTDISGNCVYTNARCQEICGFTFEQALGQGWAEFVHPADRDRVLKQWTEIAMQGGQLAQEFRWGTSDESVRWAYVRSAPQLSDDGTLIGHVGTVEDITERKRSEALLRQSEEEFRGLANAIPQLVWMAEPDGWIYWYNQGWYSYTGTTPDEMAGWGWRTVHEPAVLPTVLERWKGCIATGEPFEMTFPLRGADGVFRPFLTRVVPIRDQQGRITRWFGTNTDVSPEAEKEKQLRISQERLHAALAASATGTFRWNPYTGEFLEFDDNLKRLFGFDPLEEVRVTEDFIARVHTEDLPELVKRVDACRRGADFEMEYRVLLPHRGIRWLYDRAKMEWADGEPTYLVGACTDITTRKQAEEVQHKLAAIVESSDDAIIGKDLNGIVTSWNRSAEQMFGYGAEEMIGRSILTIIPSELRSDEDMILSKIRRGEKIEHFETVRQTKAGERVDVSLSISPVRDDQGRIIGAAKIARNMTEKKKIERALRTTEKLAAAGRLAATVAHEINNPLEAVNNLVFLAKRDLKDTQQASGHLVLAERELGRVAHIARQTLGFYRDTSSPAPIIIAKTFDDLLYLYEKRLEVRSIQIIKRYKEDIEITAYPGEIRQAFSNLITNAMDAMPRGGTLVIRVRTDRQWGGLKSTGVRITIADNGTGIQPEHRANLFEPFFTTKADVGTGLGLWITRGIVTKHGGKIQVKSSVDVGRHGTTFSIFLPFREQSTATRPGVAREVSSGIGVQ